ncbi:MAG: nitroreductase family protein [Archaeoglobus sp.]|nr:nitroreductase family protein [Archaeoglobus sp.]
MNGRILELATRRKTVRKFDEKEIKIEDVLYCIKAAKEAPSGMNAQPWKFLLVSNPELKREIREICEKGERKFHEKVKGPLRGWLKEKRITWEKRFLEEAPYLLLVFSHKKARYFIQSTWLMIGYFLLALEEKGLATVTYTPPNLDEIRCYLNVPTDYRLEAILPIGHSADEKEKEKRKSLEEIVYLEEWGSKLGEPGKLGKLI